MSDLLVVGDCNVDVIVSGPDVTPVFGDVEKMVDAATLTIGGSSSITACGAGELGVSTAMVTRVGDDPLGNYLLDEVAGFGVNVDYFIMDPEVPTGMTIALVRPGDRGILTAAGTIDRLSADDVPAALLSSARHLHVGAYYLQTALRPGLPQLFAAARAAGTTTSVDPNWDPTGRWDGLLELLQWTDILFVNAGEASAIAKEDDLVRAMRYLSSGGTTVVVKQGAAGASAMRGGEAIHAPALDIEPVDTVGAGDTFTAGFLGAFLVGASLEDTLALGCACGSLSTRGVGGTGRQPDAAEAQRAAATLRPKVSALATGAV